MNLGGFIKGLVGDYWRIAVALVSAAVLSASLGYCQGRKDGRASADIELANAARKITEAALKAERAANAADKLRREAANKREAGLRGIIDEKGTDDVVGGATGAVIERLRAGSRREDQAAR